MGSWRGQQAPAQEASGRPGYGTEDLCNYRTRGILTFRQGNCDNVTVAFGNKSSAEREREGEGGERERERVTDSFRKFRAVKTSFLGFSHQARWLGLEPEQNY